MPTYLPTYPSIAAKGFRHIVYMVVTAYPGYPFNQL
jgi:hypothetical protein